ncbi:MAG: inositol monophosphatase [Leadbetterella sp.]|nr:inositol monophosphatase [Leadbetterella sp.]
MDLQEIKNLLTDTAREAGNFIRRESERFNSRSIEYKEVNNVVSYVDKEAERMIVDRLAGLDGSIGFITEEETAATADRDGYNWIIDPLDGTANFVHGVPHYSVSLALAKGKEVLAGVVYHVPADETYWAVQGGGAWKGERQLKVSEAGRLGETLMATGFPYYRFEEMNKYIKILEELMQNTHGLRRFGSAALDLAYVAEGRYDGFFEYNLNSYDMAAGVLLVQEAGGSVTDFSGGDDYLFRGDVVAGGAAHRELLQVIKKYW